MANIKLVFQGTERSKSDDHELLAYANMDNEIFISINDFNNYPVHICLDKATAVKLVKELKLQISYLD